MCKICENSNKESDYRYLYICSKVKEIPKLLAGIVKQIWCNNHDLEYIPDTFVKLNKLDIKFTKIVHIPDTFVNLVDIDIGNTKISNISPKFTQLKRILLNNTNIKIIPDTYTHLESLDFSRTKISQIPDIFTNLTYLCCYKTKIIYIPETFTKLSSLYCEKNILINPKIYRKKTCNNNYRIFVNCQKRYKKTYVFKNNLKNITFAYNSLYIIGNINKMKLKKMFTV